MITRTHKLILSNISLVLMLVLGFGSLYSTTYVVYADSAPTVTLAPIAGTNAVVGDTVTFTASATDTDASSTIAYSLAGAPDGAAIGSDTGAFSWNTTGAAPDTYTFSVIATGSTGGSDSANVSVIVALPQEQTQGTGGVATSTGGTVVTGDAVASTTAGNDLNTSTSTLPDTPCNAGECTNSSSYLVTATSTGTLDNNATSTADTGENTVTGDNATSTIITGNATSTANVINEVNTNIFNSVGLIEFINQLFGVGLDLRNFDLSYFFDGEAGASPTVSDTGQPQCTLLTCLNSSTFNVVNDNTATVTNSVIVRASTGDNTASSTGSGGSQIGTGSAYAAANVVNLVNTNIVNSSYLLVSFNNFGNLSGDITLPGADFFERLFAHGGSAPAMNSSTYAIDNTNSVDFQGTTTASASSGDNVASSTALGDGAIATGNAYSSATSYTDANSNYFGGTSVFFLYRIHGTWTGHIRGLPAGMMATSTSDGIVVMSDPSGGTTPAEAPNANCDRGAPISNCYNSSHATSTSSNTAVVQNNVDVSASTGNNVAQSENGTSTVTTGDAYAVANVINLINTNIVGRNWMFAVFNVFGDWDGDISFGQSDLGLNASTNPNATVQPGEDVLYRFSVTNNGDADATGVVLNTNFDKDKLSFEDTSGTDTDNGRTWDIGTIRRGETRTLEYRARVGSVPAGTAITIPLTATVQGAHSSALFTVVPLNAVAPAASNGGGGGGGGSTRTNDNVRTYLSDNVNVPKKSTKEPKVVVVKSATIAPSSPDKVDYRVVVTNAKDAGPAYLSKLTDTLYKPSGEVMYTRSWNLDTLAPGDLITLTYTVAFSTSTEPGAYRNVAEVTGMAYAASAKDGGVSMQPVDGTQTIDYAPEGGLVLGAATSTCSAVPSVYLHRGSTQTQEIKNLQLFLNSHMGTNLPVIGVFGPLTEAAVKAFQNKYRNEVLTPLGLASATGGVYASTLSKMNELACGGMASAAQAPAYTPPAAAYVPAQPAAVSVAPVHTHTKKAAPEQKKEPAPAPAPAPEPPRAPSHSGSSDSSLFGGLVGWFTGLF